MLVVDRKEKEQKMEDRRDERKKDGKEGEAECEDRGDDGGVRVFTAAVEDSDILIYSRNETRQFNLN